MAKETFPHFSDDTLKFLLKASRQKSTEWLEKNRGEYERTVLSPLQHLAKTLKTELTPVAREYHFPQKGIGRIRRSAARAKEYGSMYRDYISYNASRPSGSRFDHNPNLFFLINPSDKDDPVLVAGGLYMPSSRQLRAIRETLAQDTSAFRALFASKDFKKSFPHGFSDEKKATRPPRGFDPNHPEIELLKYQAYFVWRSYPKKEWASKKFVEYVARDMRQIVRLNNLLESAINGRPLAKPETKGAKGKDASLLDRLAGLDVVVPKADF